MGANRCSTFCCSGSCMVFTAEMCRRLMTPSTAMSLARFHRSCCVPWAKHRNAEGHSPGAVTQAAGHSKRLIAVSHKAKMKDQRISTELQYGTNPFRKIFCHNQPVFVEDISFSASQIKSFAPPFMAGNPTPPQKKHPFSFCFSKYYTTGIMAQ